MAAENDKFMQGAGNAPEHHSWIDDITDDLKKVNTEFPLSGGETDEDLDKALTDDEKTSFFDDLDTEFPLSGGEIER